MGISINKKTIKKTISIAITLTFLFSPFSLVFAANHPRGFRELGYREYLQGKIRHGYYVEEFIERENRQKERIRKRNQVEEIISYSYLANFHSSQGIQEVTYEKSRNSQEINSTVRESQNQAEQVATAQTEFRYVRHSDGKIMRFTDGLPTTIENERVLDEFGNLSIRNTYNMRYNGNRLLTSYEADLKDNLGNITKIFVYGITYSPDSVFYGGYDTDANRNEMKRYIKEIDSAGNKRLTHWKALEYDGKLLRAFHQRIEDDIYGIQEFTRTDITYENDSKGHPTRVKSYHEEGIGTDGLSYTLSRTDTTYNSKDLVTGYREERITTHIDGSKTKTIIDAHFKYLYVGHQFGPDVEDVDPDRLLESIITTTTINPDGSERTEIVTTNYDYNSNQKLIDASGYSVFMGQEANWWKYTDTTTGHILTRNEDKDGNITYSYVDPDTLQTTIVPKDQVIATLKEGNKYTGSSEIVYEVLEDGRPIVKQVKTIFASYGQNISPSELQRIEKTNTIYDNRVVEYTNEQGITFKKTQTRGRTEHTEITHPLLDPNNNHMTTTNKSYEYKYDQRGNLQDLILVSGIGRGWEYQPTKGWYGRYTSTIREEYEIILGRPVRTDYYEDKDYE